MTAAIPTAAIPIPEPAPAVIAAPIPELDSAAPELDSAGPEPDALAVFVSFSLPAVMVKVPVLVGLSSVNEVPSLVIDGGRVVAGVLVARRVSGMYEEVMFRDKLQEAKAEGVI